MSPRPPATAVVVDEWPLVRLGIGQALRSLSIRVAVELAGGADAARLASDEGVGWVLLGTFRDAAAPDVVRRLRGIDPPPRVVVLLDHVTREVLSSLLSLGVDALLVRSVGPEELADAVSRVDKGERVVAPVLLPLLVGVLGATAGSGLGAGAGAGGGSGAGGGTGVGNGWADGGADADGVLTRKELEVLARLADGRSNKQIADALFVTQATVKTHLAHIYTKLNVSGRQAAVARAVELGLLR